MAVHAYNRRVFFELERASPLLSLYTRLIALELYVKERLPRWAGGHDICSLLQDGSYSTAISDFAVQLSQAVGSLRCTDRTGNAATVGDQYPNLRYLRHDSEHASGSSDEVLRAALDLIDDIADELRNSGNPIC